MRTHAVISMCYPIWEEDTWIWCTQSSSYLSIDHENSLVDVYKRDAYGIYWGNKSAYAAIMISRSPIITLSSRLKLDDVD